MVEHCQNDHANGNQAEGFWGWSIFSAWWFIILLAVFWFMDNVLGNAPAGQNVFLKQIVWKDQFFHGFSYSQLILFIVALVVGIGTIANDNRANAMLVYLSKPCTRFDYVFGKWLAIFILITSVSYIPMAIFYLYGYLSFGQYGFWTSAPWLFLKLIAVSACSGALHASLAVGISSMFNQGGWPELCTRACISWPTSSPRSWEDSPLRVRRVFAD